MKWFVRGRPPRWFTLGREHWSQGAHCVQGALDRLGLNAPGWRHRGRIPLGGRIEVHLGPLLRDTFHPYPQVWYRAVDRELVFLSERARKLLRAPGEEERLRLLVLPAVVPAGEAAGLPGALVRRWSDEVAVVLQVRAPEGTRRLTGQEARELDLDPAVLWTAARHNLRTEPLEEGTSVANGTEVELTVMAAGTRFGLAHLTRLGELLPEAARHGLLVGVVGTPGLFICHQVTRRDLVPGAVRILEQMITDEWYAPYRTAISGVYWWKDGFAEAVLPGEDGIGVPERMLDVLDRLPR
ncbi:hypothetical protein [Streptomyces coeruleorubidus]|uniref:hypothetical protein n=1 Tax=Streptomyces coeruleorubidus TaxID=116188 RepID=UPI0033A913A1